MKKLESFHALKLSPGPMPCDEVCPPTSCPCSSLSPTCPARVLDITSSQGPLFSLVAQMAKNLPAVQETWVPSLGWEEPLEK